MLKYVGLLSLGEITRSLFKRNESPSEHPSPTHSLMFLPWMVILNALLPNLLSLIIVISSNSEALATGPTTLLGDIFTNPFKYDSDATELEPWETCEVQEITTAFRYRRPGPNILILYQNSLPSLLISVITSKRRYLFADSYDYCERRYE